MQPLITADELRDYVQKPVKAATADLAVLGASGAVREQCRWSITQEIDVTLRAAGEGTRVINVNSLYLTAVDAVRVDGELLAPTAYKWATRGQLYLPERWPRWSRIEIDCTHGYPVAPDVIKIVAAGWAARFVTNPENLHIATVGSVQRTYDPLSSIELSLLDEFRLP